MNIHLMTCSIPTSIRMENVTTRSENTMQLSFRMNLPLSIAFSVSQSFFSSDWRIESTRLQTPQRLFLFCFDEKNGIKFISEFNLCKLARAQVTRTPWNSNCSLTHAELFYLIQMNYSRHCLCLYCYYRN